MFIRNSSIIFLFSLLVFTSCKNDVNLNAPYKEYPSIYAVINPFESLQMIRINKVFLGEGNAYDMAKVADSVNYDAGELSVTIKHSTGTLINFRDSVVKTAEGAFNTNQRVYVSGEKMETSGTYTLTIKNLRSGNTYSSQCKAIDRVTQNQGIRPMTPPYYPYPAGTSPLEYVDYKTYDGGTVRFGLVSDDVKIYQLVIRSHFYNEYGSGKTYDFADYAFGNRYPKDAEPLSGVPYIKTTFKRNDYFSAVGTALSKKKLDPNAIARKMWMIEYIIYASTQEMLDYLEYAKPPLGFNQNKPLYSNFYNQDALGIFTMRTTCSVQKEMATVMISEFASNLYTCQYNFYDVNNLLPGCK